MSECPALSFAMDSGPVSKSVTGIGGTIESYDCGAKGN